MAIARQVLCVSAFLWLPHARSEPIRYSVAEEAASGSVVGNVAEDAGLAVAQLASRGARLASEDGRQHFRLERGSGRLVVAERLDREQLCGQAGTCTLPFELLLAEPLQIFRVEVAVEDINDHSPVFPEERITFSIPENNNPGLRFPLEGARDLDIGSNSIQAYSISPENEYFSVSFGSRSNGRHYVELVLEKALDREEHAELGFSLIAVDGGSPPRSGTTQIHIVVLDANDNPPVFTKEIYRVRLLENLPEGSLAFQVKATDADEGTNAEITYSFSDIANNARQLFTLDSRTGDVKITGPLDYEEGKYYEASVEGRDGGGMSSYVKIQIDILDVNDNVPTLSLLPILNPVPEDSVATTVVAVISARDRDSGDNGEVSCAIDGDLPFRLEPSSENTYKLIIATALDRETVSAYNITITATDRGIPALWSRAALVLEVSDVNDNAPVFEEAAYSAYVWENNAAGALVLRVSARDVDAGANGRVSYWLAGGSAGAAPSVSVEARSGAVYAQRSFDYEQCREFAVAVRAQDGGAPARSSTATVRVFVLDRNDNAPRVLWPAAGAAGEGSVAAPFEVVPRSAEAGYLVAKVVAVDADAGRNAWLSYELVQAPEPALFRVGLHSGEVRTARAVSERDAAKQRLVAVVKDHGQPALSATATLHVVLAESLQEALPELSERAAGADSPAELQFYLVLALALLSALFVLSVALAVLARLRRAGPPAVLRCLGAQRFSVTGAAFPADFCEGTLPYSYNLCVAPGRAGPEAAWLPPPPSLPAEELLLVGEPCGKTSPSNSSVAGTGEPPVDRDTPQVCKPARSLSRRLCVPPGEGGGLRACPLTAGRRLVVMRVFDVGVGKIALSLDALQFVLVDLFFPKHLGDKWTKSRWVGNRTNTLEHEILGRYDFAHLKAPGSARCLQCREEAAGAAVDRGGARGRPERCRQPRPLPPGSLARSLAVGSAAGQFASVSAVQDCAAGGGGAGATKRNREADRSAAAAMYPAGSLWGRRERALLWCVLLAAWEAAWGQLRYSLPEEMPKGSFVGDVAKDLGLDLTALRQRGVRILDNGRTQHFTLHGQTGHLVTAGRIDREQLCESVQQCVLRCEVIVEGEMQVHGIEVEIMDINDNAPSFQEAETELRMSETMAPGSRFPLAEAHDPDVGANSLQSYELSGDEHFSLAVQAGPGGRQRPELVLAKALDREQAAFHELVLRASDGGEPARTGTARIRVAVLDANDNAPVFSQAEYTVRVPEDVPVGSTLVTLTATDADEGLNGHVKYSLKKTKHIPSKVFQLDSETGEITLLRPLDFEEAAHYELEVQAHDGGGFFDTAKMSITVTDVNDNAPEVTVSSALSAISEDAPAGTVVALLHVQDRDSGPNGEVRCSIAERLPFRLEKSFEDYYRVVTARELDREEVSEYNVTVRAADGGSPALRSGAVLALRVLDVNDNAPVFAEARYSARVPENNAAGALVLTVRARDADWGQNARVRYRLWEGRVRGAPLSSYVSVQAETGALYALRSFDYEEVREVGLWVLAEDGGAPALSSNVSVRLVIVDENDNAPQVLYPPAAPGAGWAGVELAPRSAEPGALVAKVVAVDADAGQNAWLSYELAKATEPGLFRVGLHSGEVRTARFPLARDAARQSLVVLVKDHGRPALSATATLTVVLAESVAELLAELGSAAAAGPGEAAGSLTRWLVVAVAAVSCLFLAFLLLLLALRLRRWRRSQLLPPAGSGALRGVPASHFVGIEGVRAFLHSYSHEVSLTADSRKSQLRLSGGSCCDTLPARPAPDEPAPLLGEDPAAAPVSSSGRACSATPPAAVASLLSLLCLFSLRGVGSFVGAGGAV
ncbi:LOW QUALITY PROTEIN: uncharacterized protein LJ264_009315 [Porphyrio hochstetteri]